MSQNVLAPPAVAIQQPLAPYLGVRNAATAVTPLGAFAVADCEHDFSHANTETAYKEVIKSYSPLYGLSVVAFQKSAMEVKRLLDLHSNAYSYFKDLLHFILPQGKPRIELKDENAATELIGLNLASYRTQLIEHGTKNFQGDLNPASLPQLNVELSNNLMIKGNTHQQYKITAYPTKIKAGKLSIRGALCTVASESNVFVMIIDASFISMTEIKKAVGLHGDKPDKPITVYIIRSVENSADAATKISNLDDERNNISVYYLDDDDYISISPPFDNVNYMNQMSNLFTTLSVKFYRKNDEITVEITNTNGSITTIHDIGNKSEINKATSLAFEQLIIQYAKTNGRLTQQSWEEILVFLLLKRSGDWRQALCLLDRDRKYSVKNMNNTSTNGPKISLNDLITTHRNRIEIFLMTHDRILLTYALYLGLNVGYSLRTPIRGIDSSVTWLLYFKNIADATINEGELRAFFYKLQAERIYPNVYDDVYTRTITIIKDMKPISVVSHFFSYAVHIRLLCHFLKQFVSSTMIETLLITINTKSEAISTKMSGGDYRIFAELLQLQTEITNSRNIYNTHHQVLVKIMEYNAYLQNGKIEEYVTKIISENEMSLMPGTFVTEIETIHSVNKLLASGTNIYSASTGPVAVYHRFKMTTLSSAGEDYNQIIGGGDPFYTAFKENLRNTISTSIDYPSNLKRIQVNIWKQIQADIQKEGLPINSSGGGKIRQIGGTAGDEPLLSAQQNIIFLRENIPPYDNRAAIHELNQLYTGKPEEPLLPELHAILNIIYNYFIGILYEPDYTAFILDCIHKIILPRLLNGQLKSKNIEIFIKTNPTIFTELFSEYPDPLLYNKLDYGMSFVENDRAFTIADRFIISEKEGIELERIIPICINIPDQPTNGSFHFKNSIFHNVFNEPFLLYRYTLYILDMINNKIDAFQEIYNLDELNKKDLYHYDDITYSQLIKHYTLLLYINLNITNSWNITNMVHVYWYWNDKISFDGIQLERTVSRNNLKELCATARIKCILKYYAAIRTVINTEQTFDLFLNVMPSRVTMKTITDLLPSVNLGSDNDIISKSIQYILSSTTTIKQVVIDMPQQIILLNQRSNEDIPTGLKIRFICICVSAYYCSRHITYHDNLHNNILLLFNLFNTISKKLGNMNEIYQLYNHISNDFIRNAVIYGLIIVSIYHNNNSAISFIIRQLKADNKYLEYDIISDIYLTYSIIDRDKLIYLKEIVSSYEMNKIHLKQFLKLKNIELPVGLLGGSRKRRVTQKSSRKFTRKSTYLRRKKTMRKNNKKQKCRTLKK